MTTRLIKNPARTLAFGPFLLILIFGAASKLPQNAESAPASSRAAQERILDIAIDVARRDHTNIQAARIQSEISKLADGYRTRVSAASGAKDKINAFRIVMFEVAKFEATSDLSSPAHLHIDSVLDSKKGYCLSLSVIALALAEEAGLPFSGIAAPNHFYIRYDDGVYSEALELTKSGTAFSENVLKESSRFAETKNTTYFRPLTKNEIRAVLLHNRGFASAGAGKRAAAYADFEEAAKLFPDFPETYRNRGVLLGEEKKYTEAIVQFDRALAVNSNDADALMNRAICKFELGDVEKAIDDIEIVLLLDPGRERAVKLRGAWTHHLKDHAWLAWQKRNVAPLDRPPGKLALGLLGEYYQKTNFGKLIHSRIDSEIDFEWNNSAPAPKVPRDQFSVRWTGYFKCPKNAKYTFFVIANDGVRIEFDGKRIVDRWVNMGRENGYETVDHDLVAGWHPIKIEYFDEYGGARVLLKIAADGDEKPLRLAEYLFHDSHSPR
ncbi:MAG: PA14 domain-containing protein [Planctomycetota bacterium]